uniref:Uncharacterized protein n=1 Tax=Arundo donax TaxID=35708 RepID=A0A0A9AK52_ARUDO
MILKKHETYSCNLCPLAFDTLLVWQLSFVETLGACHLSCCVSVLPDLNMLLA